VPLWLLDGDDAEQDEEAEPDPEVWDRAVRHVLSGPVPDPEKPSISLLKRAFRLARTTDFQQALDQTFEIAKLYFGGGWLSLWLQDEENPDLLRCVAHNAQPGSDKARKYAATYSRIMEDGVYQGL